MAYKKKFDYLNNGGLLNKPIESIHLDKAKAEAAIAKGEKATITLRDFIKANYSTDSNETNPFVCTIRDIGLMPFEIDIYSNRMILVEVTGKTIDVFGKETPERLYRRRCYTISGAINDIRSILMERKLRSNEPQVVCLREYFAAASKYNKYVAGIVNKDYQAALAKMEAEFPFTDISANSDNDFEKWFDNKK